MRQDPMERLISLLSGSALGAVLFSPFVYAYALLSEHISESTRAQCGMAWIAGTVAFGLGAAIFGDAFWGTLGKLLRIVRWTFHLGPR